MQQSGNVVNFMLHFILTHEQDPLWATTSWWQDLHVAAIARAAASEEIASGVNESEVHI